MLKQQRMRRRVLLSAAAALASTGLSGLLSDAAASQARSTGRRLILLELAGANDGLNTLVPTRNDHYYKLRPTIGIKRDETIALSDEQGLHSALEPLMVLFDREEIAVVQGLGYPAANRSHFKSIALWETAGDGEQSGKARGWITHSMEHELARRVSDPHGISLSGGMGLFSSDSGRWLSMANTRQILEANTRNASADTFENPALSIVNQRLHSLDQTLTQLADKLEGQQPVPAMAGGSLAVQLQQLVQLISAGVDTPVYRIRLDGFDTHENQAGRHQALLRQLGTGMADLRRKLVALGEWKNTLVMTYSEFGRRAAENDSGGTDHGTAAPHLLMGGAVSGGLYGQEPDLSILADGDPEFTVDYRAVYHRVLQGWFKVEPASLVQYRNASLSSLFG